MNMPPPQPSRPELADLVARLATADAADESRATIAQAARDLASQTRDLD